MILVGEKHSHDCISICSSLSILNQRAMNEHKYYYAQLLMEGTSRNFSTFYKHHTHYTLV